MAQSDNQTFSAEQRRHMVTEAAYYLSERRGFQEGGCMTDWLQAEINIERMLEETPTTNTPPTKRKPRTTPSETAEKNTRETL